MALTVIQPPTVVGTSDAVSSIPLQPFPLDKGSGFDRPIPVQAGLTLQWRVRWR